MLGGDACVRGCRGYRGEPKSRPLINSSMSLMKHPYIALLPFDMTSYVPQGARQATPTRDAWAKNETDKGRAFVHRFTTERRNDFEERKYSTCP